MSLTLQIAMVVAVLLYFGLLIYLLKKRRLNLKYALVWIMSGIIMLLLALFPGILTRAATLMGVHEPTNVLFAVLFFCVIIILVSLTAIVSGLNEKNKRLVQSLALLEKRVRELEKSNENAAAVSIEHCPDGDRANAV